MQLLYVSTTWAHSCVSDFVCFCFHHSFVFSIAFCLHECALEAACIRLTCAQTAVHVCAFIIHFVMFSHLRLRACAQLAFHGYASDAACIPHLRMRPNGCPCLRLHNSFVMFSHLYAFHMRPNGCPWLRFRCCMYSAFTHAPKRLSMLATP